MGFEESVGADGSWMADIRATRVVALLAPERRWTPSERPEVTVRGALGAALYDIACVRREARERDGSCAPCPHRETCVIPSWFEPPGQEVRPYVIEVDPHGEVGPEVPLRVGTTWLGEIPRPSAIAEAITRMAATGLGDRRRVHRVERLWVHGDGAPVVVMDGGRAVGAWPGGGSLARLVRWPAGEVVGARVRLVTPFQQKSEGEPVPGEVLKAAMLRARAVGRAQGVEVGRRWPPAPEGRWVELARVRGERRSARQPGRHDLSGWVGVAEFGVEIAGFVDLLVAAEVLHVGRGSSAGLGRVNVEWERSARAVSDRGAGDVSEGDGDRRSGAFSGFVNAPASHAGPPPATVLPLEEPEPR